jgi:non-ribosomal peptide synthetase component F
LFGQGQPIDGWGHRIERIIVAGEPLRISPGLRAFLHDHPHVLLHNHYGPTETHVATGARFGAALDVLPDAPPIGRAVTGMQAHLLDAEMRPVELRSARVHQRALRTRSRRPRRLLPNR